MLPPPSGKEYQKALDELVAETRRLLREYYQENGIMSAPPPGSVTTRRSGNIVFHASPYLTELAKAEAANAEKKHTEMEKRIIPPGVNFTDKPRVSGLLRERYLNHVREACQHEYIDVTEMTARMDAMMIANTEDELNFLIHDLSALAKEEVKKKQPSYRDVTEFAMYTAAVTVISTIASSPGQLFHLILTIAALILCGVAFIKWKAVVKSKKTQEKNK